MTGKRYKSNVKQMRSLIFTLAVAVTLLSFFIEICRFPEKYSTECKNQLKDAIDRGDPVSINYYNDTYVANGIILFEE